MYLGIWEATILLLLTVVCEAAETSTALYEPLPSGVPAENLTLANLATNYTCQKAQDIRTCDYCLGQNIAYCANHLLVPNNTLPPSAIFYSNGYEDSNNPGGIALGFDTFGCTGLEWFTNVGRFSFYEIVYDNTTVGDIVTDLHVGGLDDAYDLVTYNAQTALDEATAVLDSGIVQSKDKSPPSEDLNKTISGSSTEWNILIFAGDGRINATTAVNAQKSSSTKVDSLSTLFGLTALAQTALSSIYNEVTLDMYPMRSPDDLTDLWLKAVFISFFWEKVHMANLTAQQPPRKLTVDEITGALDQLDTTRDDNIGLIPWQTAQSQELALGSANNPCSTLLNVTSSDFQASKIISP